MFYVMVSDRQLKHHYQTLHTSKHPENRHGDDDDRISTLQEEDIPQTELGLESEAVGEKSDVPLRCVGR